MYKKLKNIKYCQLTIDILKLIISVYSYLEK